MDTWKTPVVWWLACGGSLSGSLNGTPHAFKKKAHVVFQSLLSKGLPHPHNPLESKMNLKKKSLLISAVLWMVIISGCAEIQQNEIPAPSTISGITRDMNRPGFWISRHSHPDDVLMNSQEIHDFNRHVEKVLGFIRNIPEKASTYDGEELLRSLEKRLVKEGLKQLCFKDGRRADKTFYHDMARQMNLENIPGNILIRYGIVTTYTNQRVLPTRQALYADPHELEFDRLQNSGLDLGTVLAILHESTDGRWQYVLSPLSSGWVETDRVALCSRDQARTFDASDSFVVVTAAKADIYLDSRLTKYHDHVRMGIRLGMAGFADDVVQVQLPGRGADGRLRVRKGYIRGENVSNGFLPYTPRNIIAQSFECLNAPYGWGGMHGEQDCSRFINVVFATVGIRLPRNSSAQAKVGVCLGRFDEHTDPLEKLTIIHHMAEVGSTLLHFNGHIMIYLGEVDAQPYVIHALWGYGDSGRNAHQIRVVNAVRVTPLSLGAGSVKGSLLDRLKTVLSIAVP